MNKRRPTVDVITMGCSKNLVDSERVMNLFSRAGYDVRHDPTDVKADEVIINTCGFIGDAKEESIEMILQCVQAREEGKIGRLTVMGCLSERYRKELQNEIPEVDRWFGKYDWKELASEILRDNPAVSLWDRVVTTPRNHAYIKISEGCNRFCSFCAIPLITGRHKSRPIEEILDEVSDLTHKGVTEFNIIAQDLSSYGTDLYGRHALAELIERMAGIPDMKWIRLHYAYPADFPMNILPVMARNNNVCKYLDIALQHISDPVLSNMRRHITADETRSLLNRIRSEVPGIHIRTTLMVGFPGENEKEFEELKDFVLEQKFEHLGIFAYSEEDDTFGAKNYEDSIPAEVKEARMNQLLELRDEIAMEQADATIGQIFEVVIDDDDDESWIGRTQFDSPEVDNIVRLPKSQYPHIKKYNYYNVKITDAVPYELFGQLV